MTSTETPHTQPDQHDVALTFFVGLHKAAAPNVREQARAVVRSLVDTNKIQMATKKPATKPASAKPASAKPAVQDNPPTPEQVRRQMSIRLSKTAVAGAVARDLAHYGQRAASAAGSGVSALLARARSGAGKAVRGVRDTTSGFEAGFQAKPGSTLDLLAEKYRAVGQHHRARKSWTQTARELLRGGSKRHIGSERHYERLTRTRGRRYADAFRLGMGTKGAVDPGATAAAARHFSDSAGRINPLTVLTGLHTTGIVSPEMTTNLIKRLTTRRPKPFTLKGMTDTQKVLGGVGLGGLGYLALRKRNPNPATAGK